jgi:predicted aspartyl protease
MGRLSARIAILGLALFGAALAAATPAAADGGCKLALKRELKVSMHGLVPGVTAKVNGADAQFVLDSGAFFSTLTNKGAARLHVPDQSGLPFEIRGLNGLVQARGGRARELVVAGTAYKDVLFVVSPINVTEGFDGLLGQNLLSFHDAEYDFAHGAVRLFEAAGCEGQMLAYWAAPNQPYGVIDIERINASETAVVGRVIINGQPVRAIFDTGNPHSLITLATARRLGIDLGGKGVMTAGVTKGIAEAALETRSVPIDSFQIDQEVIRNTRVNTVHTDIGADMLIGADFFLAHRVFVAKSQHKLYFTYNGGPIFQLAPAGAGKDQAASAKEPPPAL